MTPCQGEIVNLGNHRTLLAGGALLLFAAIITATAELSDRDDPITVPHETQIHVRLDQSLSSDQSRSGDHFAATISEPVVIDNKTVIPEGTRVEGLVVEAHPSGRLMGRARLQLALESFDLDGQHYQIRTSTANRVGGNHKKRNWAWIAGGGGGGALIGALAGGGKGALIGGPVGAGPGTAVAFMTGKKDIHLAPEMSLTFRLAEPVTIDHKG
jgi:hypothetical protein